jgi:hypothetical protein
MAVIGMHHFNICVSQAEIGALKSLLRHSWFSCWSLYLDGSARSRRNTDFLSRPEREWRRANLFYGWHLNKGRF